jgi:hypothetical protein
LHLRETKPEKALVFGIDSVGFYKFKAMTDTSTDTSSRPALPDRLAIDARSPHHVRAGFEHDIGIRFNGKDRNDVEEYCISEGWVRVPAGKTLDRKGQPLLIKIKGTVEAFYL